MLIWYPWQVAYRISNLIHGFFFFFYALCENLFLFAGAINTKSKVNVTTHRGISNCVILLLSLPSPITYAFSSPPPDFFLFLLASSFALYTHAIFTLLFFRPSAVDDADKKEPRYSLPSQLTCEITERHKLLSQTKRRDFKMKMYFIFFSGGGIPCPARVFYVYDDDIGSFGFSLISKYVQLLGHILCQQQSVGNIAQGGTRPWWIHSCASETVRGRSKASKIELCFDIIMCAGIISSRLLFMYIVYNIRYRTMMMTSYHVVTLTV